MGFISANTGRNGCVLLTEIAPDGYAICPECGHHTSAYAGRCTVLIPLKFDDEGFPVEMTYCNCDCRVVLGGKSIAEILWGKD